MVDYRSIVSQDELNLEDKNVKIDTTQTVFIDFMGSTNVKFSLPLQPHDRRTEIIHFNEERFPEKRCKKIDEIELKNPDYKDIEVSEPIWRSKLQNCSHCRHWNQNQASMARTETERVVGGDTGP